MWRTTQHTFLAINLARQQKTTKLYFSSQVRKQFKLLAVPFKPLRCFFRNFKLVNCHLWQFCKDLFLTLRVIWSVNQIVLLNGFLSDLLRSLRVYILKQLFFSISVNSGFGNIYLAAFAARSILGELNRKSSLKLEAKKLRSNLYITARNIAVTLYTTVTGQLSENIAIYVL